VIYLGFSEIKLYEIYSCKQPNLLLVYAMKACRTVPIATPVLNPHPRKGKWLVPRPRLLTLREKAFDTHWRLGGTTFDLESFEER